MPEPQLKVQVEEISQIERKLSIEVAPEVVTHQLELAYRTLSEQVRVAGFRPGKVPRRILEQKYRQQVEDQVIRDVTERAYLEALESHSVDAVASPSLTNEGLKRGKPFAFQARVQVRPKVAPTDYVGLTLTKREAAVSDAQVTERLEAIRQRMAKLEKVERDVAKAGDWATIDYVATVHGKDFPGGKATGVTVEIAPGELANSKIAALEGVKVGESKVVEYAFPADYQVDAVKGQTARFEITVRDVKIQVTPELDDAFAKEIGGGDTVQQMRDKVRAEMLAAEKTKLRAADREEVIAELLKKNPFEVPRAMVDRAIDGMLQTAIRNMARSGVDPSQLRLDFDSLREELREKATSEVKGALALEAISVKENIDTTDPDVDRKMDELALETGSSLDALKKALNDPAVKRQFYERLREEKTVEFLKSRAKY